MSATPGWYDDPSQSGRLRYWDGQSWTEHTHDGEAPAPAATPPAATPEATFTPSPTATFTPSPTASADADRSFATLGMPSSLPAASSASPQPTYAAASRSYSPTPYVAPTGTPKRRLGAGAIAGIVAGALVLVGLIGVGVVWALNNYSGDPDETAVATDPTTATPSDDVESAEPTAAPQRAEHADIPADYAVPEGYVELRHPELGVVYGVPPEWVDITDLYRPYFGDEPELTGGELVTFLEAWTPDSGDGLGTDEVLVLQAELPRSYTTDMYSVGARRGFDYTAGAQTWSEARTYTNDVGVSVTVASGTPVEPGTFVSTQMYVVGGGETMVLVQCTSYLDTGNCAAVEAAIATMWVG